MKTVSFEDVATLFKKGSIGILPTDTLYGLVASALDRDAVERVYRVRGRDEGKPCIVLIGDVADIEIFACHSEPARNDSRSDSGRRSEESRDDRRKIKEAFSRFWPGKVSVILPCPGERFAYLHRGTGTIAFRLPDKPELRELLRKVGSLIAPSANPQRMSPAKTIEEAEEYFGDAVDFYVDGGTLDSEPSTVVRFTDEKLSVVREGAVKIQNQEL